MTTRTRGVGLGLTLTMMTVGTAGCGMAQDKIDETHSSASARVVTTVKATAFQGDSSTGAAGSSSSDAPIGGGDIDMGSSSAASYPPDKVSSQGAQDCFAAGTRIYDRSGVTCTEAKTVLARYNGLTANAKGAKHSVNPYTCQHNPDIMVTQGAAPGQCVNGDGDVVFSWRYPGAPAPAH